MVEAMPTEAYPLDKGASAKVTFQHGTVRRRKWYQLGGKDFSHVAVDLGYENASETSSLHDDDISFVKHRHNVFEDKAAADIYRPIEGYEGAHRFHPEATWTEAEEKAIRRKVRCCTL